MSNSRDLPEIEWPDGVSDAEKDELRDVLRAYDNAVSDFERDHTVIFPSEQERKRLFHAVQERWLKAWSKPGPCMHPGCSSRSIPRSHTIPMSASLKEIAEQGHLVTPRFGKNGIELVRIGIRDASTFPGFCDIHEAQFGTFESQKKMTTTDHFYLQAFRTICREIYTNRHYAQKLQSELDDYRKLRGAFIAARMNQVHSAKPIDIKSVTFKNDPLEDQYVEHIKTSSQDLIELEQLYQAVLDALKTGAGNCVMFVANLDLKVPVCLSGIGVLRYRTDSTTRRALCFLAVIPEATETKFIIGAERSHEAALTVYMNDESSTVMLARVESWMCHGSDHWFMTPSVWDAIPPARKDAICSRILDEEPSIAHPVEFSVLDGVRAQILASADAQLRDGSIPAEDVGRAMQLVADDKVKLNWISPQTQAGNKPK